MGGRQPRAVMKALDLNADGRLSLAEIQNASTALRYLDEDGDGVLTGAS